jgi:hypothetical protein
VLDAKDEDIDTIVQDWNGIDHIVSCMNGQLYWSLYGSEEYPEPDDGFYFTVEYDIAAPVANQRKKTLKKPDGTSSRPPTAYNLFLKQKLRELSKTHSHLSNKDRMRLASDEWKAMK